MCAATQHDAARREGPYQSVMKRLKSMMGFGKRGKMVVNDECALPESGPVTCYKVLNDPPLTTQQNGWVGDTRRRSSTQE